ncbi:hypothetical protein JHFBIEKO_4672 [Methylobacterium mesophilicum]|nr:hypothetical protein JHFBIEKO_4672 [Methylobacterium mesophilicum]
MDADASSVEAACSVEPCDSCSAEADSSCEPADTLLEASMTWPTTSRSFRFIACTALSRSPISSLLVAATSCFRSPSATRLAAATARCRPREIDSDSQIAMASPTATAPRITASSTVRVVS